MIYKSYTIAIHPGDHVSINLIEDNEDKCDFKYCCEVSSCFVIITGIILLLYYVKYEK